jgi:hypothetical protein
MRQVAFSSFPLLGKVPDFFPPEVPPYAMLV